MVHAGERVMLYAVWYRIDHYLQDPKIMEMAGRWQHLAWLQSMIVAGFGLIVRLVPRTERVLVKATIGPEEALIAFLINALEKAKHAIANAAYTNGGKLELEWQPSGDALVRQGTYTIPLEVVLSLCFLDDSYLEVYPTLEQRKIFLRDYIEDLRSGLIIIPGYKIALTDEQSANLLTGQ
jgi:hypothetical protein